MSLYNRPFVLYAKMFGIPDADSWLAVALLPHQTLDVAVNTVLRPRLLNLEIPFLIYPLHIFYLLLLLLLYRL